MVLGCIHPSQSYLILSIGGDEFSDVAVVEGGGRPHPDMPTTSARERYTPISAGVVYLPSPENLCCGGGVVHCLVVSRWDTSNTVNCPFLSLSPNSVDV